MGCCADKIVVEFPEETNALGDPLLNETDNNTVPVGHNTNTIEESNAKELRLQVERLPSFNQDGKVWILDKHRDRESSKSAQPNVKAYSYDKKLMAQKRVTLSDKHNFLWLTSIIQGSMYSAEQQSEITRVALDKVLNLLPVPFRDKIWEITNVEQDTFIVSEEYEEFVDALLIATGQYKISSNEFDDDYEFRNMSHVFARVIKVDQLFSRANNVSNALSRTTQTLSNIGATQVVVKLRNLDGDADIPANDIAIPMLTGFTKKAIKHSVKYCTRIWWKILTDVWWDEDNQYDTALPAKLNEYRMKRRTSRRTSKVTQDVRTSLIATSMNDLFPDLYESITSEKSDDEEPHTYDNHLKPF
eukprot:109966_1